MSPFQIAGTRDFLRGSGMVCPVFQDLIKPQWRKVLETLKLEGSLPVTELARQTGTSYMAAKGYCEDLAKLGYLVRSRRPRTEVGRPEITYSLAAMAEGLFPQTGITFTLELLDDVRRIFGESVPEKLVFQHLQRQQEAWQKPLAAIEALPKKVAKLVKLRQQAGCIAQLHDGQDQPPGWTEVHHPLQAVFSHYPRTATIELRMIEELLGCRVQRREADSGREAAPRVTFQLEPH